jgi:hypothetical protein
LNHSFIVGETYQDRVGLYKVVCIEGNRLLYQYADTIQHEADADRKWRIHRNVLLEQGAAAHIPQRVQSNDEKGFFTHAEVFPIIANAIETYCRKHANYMTHEEIVEAVMKDPQGQAILERRPDKTKLWSAGVMVAWFSKIFTDGTSEWDARFERKRIGLPWAYRVRKSGAD